MRHKRPHGLMGILALAAIGLAGCSATTAPPDPGQDDQWFESVFDDGQNDGDTTPTGGGTLGATITTKPLAAGWYAVDLACKGSAGASFTISAEDELLGEGDVGCGSSGFTTTTMQLPAGTVSATADSKDPRTIWQVRMRPTTAPAT